MKPSAQACAMLALIGLVMAANVAVAAEPPADQLGADLEKLEEVADSYPPEIKAPAERTQTEALWHSVEARLLRALQASPHDFETELRLGNLYRMGNNLDIKDAWDKAVIHLKEAARLRPDSPLPLTMLGAHYSGSGHAADAEAPLLRALAVSGDKPSPAIYANLAFTYYQLGRFDKVVPYATEYLKTHPDSSVMKMIKEKSEEALHGGRKSKKVHLDPKPPRN
jgi:tetratricopeptide (TPR) repeat protein